MSGEDRVNLKKAMNELGIEMARGEWLTPLKGPGRTDKLGYPVVLYVLPIP